jgi:C-terminal processing protease CtpA/Prc
MKTHRLVITLLGLVLMAPAAATVAQEPEPDRAKQEAAQRRLERAQHALQEALERLRQERYDEAVNEELARAIAELRAAQSELRRERVRELAYRIRADAPGVAVVSSRPMMGVFLERTEYREGVDSVGVRIQSVTPGGPAEEAGLRAGDVIVRANGERIGRTRRGENDPYDKLVDFIHDADEGDTLRVQYLRDGQTQTADVVLRPLSASSFAIAFGDSVRRNIVTYSAPSVIVEADPPRVGIAVEPQVRFEGQLAEAFSQYRWSWLRLELTELEPEMGRTYFGTESGLLVVKAPDDSELDLRAGDVILSIDGREPTSPSHMFRILRSYEPGETVTFHIMRNRERQTVTTTVPGREDRGFFWERR